MTPAQRERLDAIHAYVVRAGDDRLDGVITRDQHAAIIQQAIVDLEAAGLGWRQFMDYQGGAS